MKTIVRVVLAICLLSIASYARAQTNAVIAGIVRDATGAVIRDLPLTPERVWRALHDEVVANDAQLQLYVRMLEHEHDRRAEASIPSADDIGAQFEQFLREHRED